MLKRISKITIDHVLWFLIEVKKVLARELLYWVESKMKGVSVMKNLILTSVLSMIVAVGLASVPRHASSSLQVNINEHGPYTVEVDGYQYQSQGNSVFLDRLTPGTYRVRIIRFNPQARYRGPHRRPSSMVVYDEFIQVPAYSTITANYNRFGMKVNRVIHRPVRQRPAPCVQPPVQRRPDRSPRVNRPCAAPIGMLDRDFQQLLYTLDNSSFDQTRLSIAKSAVNNNYMSTNQIAVVMRKLSFDSYRLDFAKFAHARCIDQHNYYHLTNELAFESNARHLINFIS